MSSYDAIDARRAALTRQLADLQTQLDALELLPEADTYAGGTVIRAVIHYRGRTLTYVFLKIVDDTRAGRVQRWYHTGFLSHSGASHAHQFFDDWNGLMRWLSEPGRVVESWEVMERFSGAQTILIELNDDTPTGLYTFRRSTDGTYRGVDGGRKDAP